MVFNFLQSFIASETISAVYDLLQDYQIDNGEEISQIQKYPYTDLEEGREKAHDIEDSYFDVEDFTESSDYYENQDDLCIIGKLLQMQQFMNEKVQPNAHEPDV